MFPTLLAKYTIYKGNNIGTAIALNYSSAADPSTSADMSSVKIVANAPCMLGAWL